MNVELPEGVTMTTGPAGLPMVRVETPSARAEIALHGAHITSWVPAGEQDALWLSPEAIMDGSAAIRGGVPLCGPWFGKGPKDDKSPSHGWFRTNTWTLTAAARRGDDVRLAFTLDGRDRAVAIPDGEPRQLTATYIVSIGHALELSLSIEADEQVDVETALHLYARVADARQAYVDGLDGAAYIDKMNDSARRVQEGPVTFTEETDRIYLSASDCALVDPVEKRQLMLTKQGSSDTVVWNPWTTTAATLADMPDDGWETFVCVETAQVGGHATRLQKGDVAAIRATYTLASA